MFRFISNTHFCYCVNTIITRTANPYLGLSADQLRLIIKEKLAQKHESVEHINALIELGVASKTKKMTYELQQIVKGCMAKMENMQNIINRYQQQQLVQLEMGQLLAILSQSPHHLTHKQAEKLTQLYLNTYSHLFGFTKQLKIYEHSQNYDSLDLVAKISSQKLHEILAQRQINLADFVAYLRLFSHQTVASQINKKLKQYKSKQNLCRLTEQQQLILFYLMIKTSSDINLLKQLNIQPNLSLNQKQQGKFSCIKLQILKHKQLPIIGLNVLDLADWNYNNLIWVSQFCAHQSQFKQKLHQCILNSNLPKGIQPSTIFTYACNAQVTGNKHTQICNWLCEQNRIALAHEQSLCNMLSQIHQKRWEPYYQKFYRLVLKMSLGNFKWESQNAIYYYGAVQDIQDQNMEYLRRYILNTYAALGTARKEIPTSSYFYKILGIVNVQNFYKHY